MTKRRRHRNGWITGYRSGNWWIGVRRDFAADGIEVCCFGFTLFVPGENYWRDKR